MIRWLLFIIQGDQWRVLLIWTAIIACLLLLVVVLYWQYRQGKKLRSELDQLGKLQKHNVEYEFVLEAMRLSIWHLDIKSMEFTFEQDFRQKGDQYFTNVDGMSLDDSVLAIDPRDAPRVNKAMTDLCEGHTNSYHETYRVPIAFTNKTYWEESYATVAERDVDGKPTRLVGTTMRIDDRKEMEEALVEARNRAEESDRLKTAFIANMSHEIRTPLNAIVGFTSVLPDIEDAAERKALLDLIHENTQKLLRIVDDVVNISKIESGKEELVMTAFDLNLLLQENIELFSQKANAGVTVSSQFAMDTLIVTTDLSRLTEIIKHLLSNATKFTEQGCIVVGYESPFEGRIRIWVRDTGKGIAPEFQQRIFERFFKVDEFIPGAGLGLSICHTMAFSLGGSVSVESKLGEGSTFTVEIPIN